MLYLCLTIFWVSLFHASLKWCPNVTHNEKKYSGVTSVSPVLGFTQKVTLTFWNLLLHLLKHSSCSRHSSRAFFKNSYTRVLNTSSRSEWVELDEADSFNSVGLLSILLPSTPAITESPSSLVANGADDCSFTFVESDEFNDDDVAATADWWLADVFRTVSTRCSRSFNSLFSFLSSFSTSSKLTFVKIIKIKLTLFLTRLTVPKIRYFGQILV